MDEFPKVLQEVKHRHDLAEDYSRPPVGRALREELEEAQGLPSGEVAVWAGHLMVGVVKGDRIYSKETGKDLGPVPPGLVK